MPVSFVLLAGPLVGPSVWEPGAGALRRRGHEASVVDLRAAVTPAGPDLEAVARRVQDACGAGPVVLVPHSGAGPLTPPLARRIQGVTGVVFVDAGMPPAGAGRVPLAPDPLLDELASMADRSGMLPPWSSWWDEGTMARLIPDERLRLRAMSEMRPLPLGYFRSSVEVPGDWPAVPGAFLAFGTEAYGRDLQRAEGFGWPVRMIEGAGHLHMAVEPDVVAESIVDLAGQIRTSDRVSGEHPPGWSAD